MRWLLDTVCVFCLIQAQLGITETELQELISERERKVEEVHSSLREIKVSDVNTTAGRRFAYGSYVFIL